MIQRRKTMILAILAGGWVQAQTPITPSISESMCAQNKKSAISKIQGAQKNKARQEKGFNPILWAMLDEMKFKFKNFRDLAEQIYDLDPEDTRWIRNSDPAGRATDAVVKEARIETIRKQLSMHVRERWGTIAGQEKGLPALEREIRSLFSSIRFSQGTGSSSQAVGEVWNITLKNAEGDIVQFAFDARGRGAVALERSIGNTVTHSGMDAWKHLVQHLFDQDALKANLMRQSRSDDYAKFSLKVLRYLDTKGLWAKIGLGDDALKQLIGRGSPELIARLGEETARATTRTALWDSIEGILKRRPSRATWIVAAVLGGAIVVYNQWDNWFGNSENEIEKRVGRAIAYLDEHDANKGFGTTDRAWMKKYLVAIIEDGAFEDVDAISATIWGMGCDTATALNYFLLFNKEWIEKQ